LFRTFLFITHNCTPEGDKLKQVTGLQKEDMKYWKIDRLSTFVNLNDKKYPGISNLFKTAGLEDLLHLKDKSFDVNKMQEANLDGFLKFMHKENVFDKFYKKS
jgi:hypothetical protein